MDVIEKINIRQWNEPFSAETQMKAVQTLEDGQVLFFPELAFALNDIEKQFLSPEYVDGKAKNISFDIRNDRLGGALCDEEKKRILKAMMKRYAQYTQQFIHHLLPNYQHDLEIARTSFRPVEIIGRVTSYRKDDTRLHVDAFPSTPNQGRRILRVFSNVNPDNKPRVWRVGDRFENVAKKFMPNIANPLPGSANFLKLFNLTKSYRTPYDHFMLRMHNTMKADLNYQQVVPQQEIQFPSGSTWIVYTDCVSHAAMSGQFLFEQTFHLPVTAMQNENKSPLRILEKITARSLV